MIGAELVAMGFTANEDILDGEIGVARMLGLGRATPRRSLTGWGRGHGDPWSTSGCAGGRGPLKHERDEYILPGADQPDRVDSIEMIQ